jgi:hypothetical protein
VTLADAQFSLIQSLRPPEGFVAAYEGQANGRAIAMPGTLDSNAGEAGYDADLMAGVNVPLGAKMMLWFPDIVNSEGPVVQQPYTYQLIWRMRTPIDYRDDRKPFHLAQQRPGAPDTSVPVAAGRVRFFLPAATETVVFNQAEPGAALAVPNLRRESLNVIGNGNPPALFPFVPPYALGNTGIVQQGVLDPGGATPLTADSPLYMPYFTIAKGDELMIWVTRTAAGNWAFAAADLGFATLYGSTDEDVGVLVTVGSSPT